MTFTLAIICFQVWFVHHEDFVFGVRVSQSHCVVEILTDVVGMFQFDFVTAVLRFSQVGSCHGHSNPLRTSEILCQNVVTLLVEEVKITTQQTVPQSKFQT